MDLVSSGSRVVITMEHTSKKGDSKILKKCSLPLTAANCVDLIITELAVFECNDGELVLTEIAPGVTQEEVRAKTEADYTVSPNLKEMQGQK